MSLKSTYTWRGVIRGELRSLKRRSQALLNYQVRHAEDFTFLSSTDTLLVKDFQALLDRKLTQTGTPLPPGLLLALDTPS